LGAGEKEEKEEKENFSFLIQPIANFIRFDVMRKYFGRSLSFMCSKGAIVSLTDVCGIYRVAHAISSVRLFIFIIFFNFSFKIK
jgi:hypothetical protein